MNGATPDGPKASISTIASAKSAACSGSASRDTLYSSSRIQRPAKICAASAPPITSSSSGVTSGAGPPAVNSRPSSSSAMLPDSARKKIHARQTMWNVSAQRAIVQPRPCGFHLDVMARSATSPTP